MLRECHAPCTLKTSFVDFENKKARCSHYKILNVSSLLNIPNFFSGSRNLVDPFLSSILYGFFLFIYVIELVLVLNITEMLLAGRYAITNQSIKDAAFKYEKS